MNSAEDVLPHDLLWGMPASALPDDAPLWAVEAVCCGHPVVVRRAQVPSELVAVGIRGANREQRFAARMPRSQILRCVHPEQLTHLPVKKDWPALTALEQIRPLMDGLGLAWGVSGSAGFELACGVAALHQNSDLDVIVRTPAFISRGWAAELVSVLGGAVCRIDVQLQTPSGALALREWAGASLQVLLKSERGARLVAQPWQLAGACA